MFYFIIAVLLAKLPAKLRLPKLAQLATPDISSAKYGLSPISRRVYFHNSHVRH
jgi:hypothetical protein